MNLKIRSKDITLTENTRSHIESALEAFGKYGLEITTLNCNIATEKKGVSVEFDIHIAHAQPVVITQSDEDLDTAIDLAIEKGAKALRRLHDKVVSHKATSVKDLETIDA